MPSSHIPHPFGLTPAEAAAVSTVIETGSHKLAARLLGVAHKTIDTHIAHAKAKAKVTCSLHLYLAWDRAHRPTE